MNIRKRQPNKLINSIFTKGNVIYNLDDKFHTTSELSDRVSKDLYKRGMKFVGSTIIYSYLQAVGIINDHQLDCDFRGEVCHSKKQKNI